MIRKLKLNIITLSLLLVAGQCYSQTWLPVGPGIECMVGAYVWDINVSEDSSELYVAGKFNRDGDCNPMRATLNWDGNQYSQVAQPLTGSESTIVFGYQGNIYSSGYLVSQPGSLIHDFNVKDDEGNWALVPNGFSGAAMDYHIRDGIVYLAGALSYCGGVPCGLVCTYDGEQVLPYYTGSPIGDYALRVNFYQDTLYVAGFFTGNDGLHTQGYNKCCKIVNGQLEKVANGFNAGGGVCAGMEVMDDKLYIGGWTRAVGFDESHSIYYYQNGQLYTLPEEPDDLIFAMTTYNGGLYVAGGFTQIGDMPCNQVARWDGENWTCLCHEPFTRVITSPEGDTLAVHPCLGQCIKDMVVWNDTLYVAGSFHQIGNTETRLIAKLDMALSEAFPVGVKEQNKEEVRLNVYPNPASTKLNIQLDQPSAVSVYTATGQLMETHTSKSSYQVDVSGYPPGLYLVVSGGVHRRFVKE